jgi:hypothetical protein
MKATHTVKYNGKWYKAGEEIGAVEKTASIPFETPKYTKTDINRMSTTDLQSLASESGIPNADSFSGADLKSMLIDKFRL